MADFPTPESVRAQVALVRYLIGELLDLIEIREPAHRHGCECFFCVKTTRIRDLLDKADAEVGAWHAIPPSEPRIPWEKKE